MLEKIGIIYDAKALLKDVRDMTTKARLEETEKGD